MSSFFIQPRAITCGLALAAALTAAQAVAPSRSLAAAPAAAQPRPWPSRPEGKIHVYDVTNHVNQYKYSFS